MRFHSVSMLDSIPGESNHYDLAIYASGFEARATYVAKSFEVEARRTMVLFFEPDTTVLSRADNDSFFESLQFASPGLIYVDHETKLCETLDELTASSGSRGIRVMIDYSAMTRAWYATILNWARFTAMSDAITMDFVYAYGRYLGDFHPLAISEIVSLPGFEGVSGGFRSTAAIFGLGYDKYATLAVYDRLEPDSVSCFVAKRFAEDPNGLKVEAENAEIIETSSSVFSLPLGDIEGAFRVLADNVELHDDENHIVMVPMGPKTHVLASLLVGLRFPHVTCLHARGNRAVPVQVEATGDLSIARVEFLNPINVVVHSNETRVASVTVK